MSERMEETDPRYLEPFVAGMQAARMAIVKRGWSTDAPMSTSEAVAAIDQERGECVRLIVAEQGAPASKVRPGQITDGMVEAYAHSYHEARKANKVPSERIRAGLVAALTRRELEQRTEPELHPINLDPYPGTVGEVADEIVRYVVELHESGAARHLVDEVFSRLADWRSSRDDGIAEHESNRHPDLDEIF